MASVDPPSSTPEEEEEEEEEKTSSRFLLSWPRSTSTTAVSSSWLLRVPFGCRLAPDARHHGRYAPKGQSCVLRFGQWHVQGSFCGYFAPRAVFLPWFSGRDALSAGPPLGLHHGRFGPERHYAALVAKCGSGMCFCFILRVDAVHVAFSEFVGRLAAVSTASCGRQFVHGVHAVGYRTLALVAIPQLQFLDKVIDDPVVRVVQVLPSRSPVVCNDRCPGYVPQWQLNNKAVYTPVVAQSLISMAVLFSRPSRFPCCRTHGGRCPWSSTECGYSCLRIDRSVQCCLCTDRGDPTGASSWFC